MGPVPAGPPKLIIKMIEPFKLTSAFKPIFIGWSEGQEAYLTSISPTMLNLKSAQKWAKSNGGVLPSQEVLKLIHKNSTLRPSLTETRYWTGDRLDANYQWVVYMNTGQIDAAPYNQFCGAVAVQMKHRDK